MLLALSALPIAVQAERRIRRQDIQTPTPLPPNSLLVVGFLGAWEEWDNPKRSVRKVALSVREKGWPGVYVETAGNHSRSVVRRFVREAFDRNRDGRIDRAEAASAQLILYGQSFGGAAAVYLARELQRDKIPVRLTVQVDSVGRRDNVIPANVRRAVNFFQNDPGPIRGQARIVAEDAAKTTILGNFQHFYLFRDIDMSDYPAAARKLGLSHWKMDNDPLVWAQVEGLILAEILAWQAESAGVKSSRLP
jgi:hypothetical protein